MSRIIYEKENVEEKITSGIIPLMNRSKVTGKIISVEEAIIEELKMENPDIDIENIRIEIDGSYDAIDNGDYEDIYEDQVVKYVVYQNIEKSIPYKVEEELVDTGLLTEAESALSDEEKDKVVFDILRRSNKFSGNEEDYSINYVGAVDDLYDNPLEEYEVYRIVSKKRLEEDEEFENDNSKANDTEKEETNKVEEKEDVEELKKTLENLKELRAKLDKLEDAEERKKIIDELNEKQDKIAASAREDKSQTASETLEKELAELEEEIKKIQKEIKDSSKEYDKIYEELKNIIDEQRDKIENSELLSDEEIRDLLEYFDKKKLEVNGKSVKLSNQIEEQKKQLSRLKSKKTKLEKEIKKAQEIGLSYDEYKEIADASIGKKSTLKAILDSKGLGEVLDKKKSERTEEEEKEFEEAKKDIVREISEARKNDENMSVLEAIEFLYPVKVVKSNGKQKVISMSKEEIDNIKENATKEPEKIKPETDDKSVDYVPGEAPEDMMASNVLVSGIVSIDEIYLRGLTSEEVEERFREEAIKDLASRSDFEYDPEEMDIVIVGAEVDDAASDIQYTRYEVVPKEKNKVVEDNKAKVKAKVLTDGRVFIDDIYLRGLTSEEVEDRYIEEIIKDLADRGFEYDPDKMDIIIDGADVDEAAPEIQYMKYEVVSKEDVDDDVLENGDVAGIIDNDGNDNNGGEIEDADDNGNDGEEDEDADDNGNDDDEDEDTDENENNGNIDNNDNDDIETLDLYEDVDTGDIYVEDYIIDRFNLVPSGGMIEVEGILCRRIERDDADYIINNANNDYAPYTVNIIRIRLGKEDTPEENEEDFNNIDLDRDPVEIVTLFRDLDNDGEIYVRKYVVDRFHLDTLGDPVRIEGSLCYRIDEEDADYIIENANNDYSPYQIDVRDVHLGKRNSNDDDDNIDNGDGDNKDDDDENINNLNNPIKEKVVLYRDIDTGDIYVKKAVVTRFHLDTLGDPVRIKNYLCYKIDEEDVDYIIGNANNDYSPYEVVIEDVQLDKDKSNPVPTDNDDDNDKDDDDNKDKDDDNNNDNDDDRDNDDDKKHDEDTPKKKRISLQEIIRKITDGVDIGKKDAKRYNASNIKVSKQFADELHSGNYLYNILHVVPNVFKVGINFFKKLGAKLLLTKRGKAAVEEIKNRLDNLSEEELETLFNEYRGSTLKTQMNFSIDPLILAKMKEYGMAKIEKLNEEIKQSYTALYVLLGQIKAIEEQLLNPELSDAEKKKLIANRRKLMGEASTHVQNIESKRIEANNLLSGGIHGLEEDFKAVATKMNYVGLRFAKANKFDHELQAELAKHDQAMVDAIDNGDDEAVVSNFMAMEALYYKNTKISGSLVGKRSVGSKYYTPLAEEFNYNNDPFIRDLFTTIAITSAVVSAINSVRVHKVEADEMLKKQQNEVNNLNAHNDMIMNKVHKTGADIEGHRGVFEEGMKAQGHQNVLNSSNMVERSALDYHDWSFGKAYRVTDDANHEFYNSFHESVTSQINGITAKYGTGSITQAEALQQMADVVNSSQATLTKVAEECLAILKPYAASHPQFNLTAVQESMEYIIAHPDAIAQMNQGMVEVTDLASGLQGLSVEHATALSGLPSDMISTLICAASATALALNVSNTMNYRYGKKDRRYGNDVTDMMEQYLAQEEADEEVDRKKKV